MSKLNTSKSYMLLKENPRFRKASSIIIFVLMLCLIGAMFVPWQQTIYGGGRVIALSPTEREQVISAPIHGRLGKWYVEEGSYVQKGDPIVNILDIDPGLMDKLKQEKAAIELKVKASEKAVEAAERNVEREKHILDKGLGSERAYDNAQVTQMERLQELSLAKVKLTQIRVEIARQESRLVKAPTSGVITQRVSGEDGVIVKQAEPLATLVPDTDSRIAELWISGNDAVLVKDGDKVMLQFEGWPAVQFSGWPEIAIGTFRGRVIFVSPHDNAQGQVKIFVAPLHDEAWPNHKFLRQGLRVKGWVMLRSVPLGYEMWRRYNGFPPNVNMPVLHVDAREATLNNRKS